ncbi:MAG TPA: tRNA (adenosine(37)-N6)-threonylcarbamoyltransferase complex ATPase subunit type 1 TsaE [Steroidobacteraceae bacterium]|nr:tRNA (adenosine(37)-N6)-threonylcarbamoyltransferase complex ATPase subunit type 1 TsaE [Steroidobacteraceae bacterium]
MTAASTPAPDAGSWIALADESATAEFAARLARALPAATPPLVIYLHGDLGAGKTTLARGMLRAMGETGAVRSPTYALMAEYQPAGTRVLHLDLYRLDSPDDLLALGLADHLPGSTVWLIEWPEKGAGGGLPPADAAVYLEPDGRARRACIVPRSASGARWAAAVAADSG